ncbi:MAG TPA: hypothetical protein VLQ89_00690, partial [Candidatus Binatia bacterium]|nr:hypothetical protein [Candidatus Binatia bacterium]
MKQHVKIIRSAVWLLAFSAMLAIFLPGHAPAERTSYMSVNLQQEAPDLYKHPKIDSTLGRLIHVFRTQGSAAMKRMAEELQLDFDGDRLRVTVLSADNNGSTSSSRVAAELLPRILSLGGKVETSYNGDVQSLLPI